MGDIGLKYYSNEDLQHILTSIKAHYDYHIHTMNWNYKEGCVDLSILKYIPNLSQRLKHKTQNKPEYWPHENYPVIFTKKGER